MLPWTREVTVDESHLTQRLFGGESLSTWRIWTPFHPLSRRPSQPRGSAGARLSPLQPVLGEVSHDDRATEYRNRAGGRDAVGYPLLPFLRDQRRPARDPAPLLQGRPRS